MTVKDYQQLDQTIHLRQWLMMGESDWSDVMKMMAHAEQWYRIQQNLRGDEAVPDCAIQFVPHDEGILIQVRVVGQPKPAIPKMPPHNPTVHDFEPKE